MLRKRGQASGAGAATLVLILTIMIILYITFLPSGDRAAILGEDPAMGYGQPGSGVLGETAILLRENPGRLEYLAHKEIEHSIPTVNLYLTTAATELKALRSLSLKHGWLDEVQTNFTFSLPDMAQTSKVLLTFNRPEGEGQLSIFLNGVLIFQDVIEQYNVEPIELPKDVLQPHNQVLFAVDGVGLRFWRTNHYRLEDIHVIADVTDTSTTTSREIFVVTEAERNNVERATLRFFPDCVPGKVGVLTVQLNGHEVFSGVPDCGVVRSMEISPAYLLTGENSLEFGTQKGVYLVDQITLRTQMKDLIYPSYTFSVDERTLEALAQGRRAILSLQFPDTVTLKNAQVFVNGRAFSVSTRDAEWWMVISPYLQRGTNAVEIIPRTALDVVNLEVVLE